VTTATWETKKVKPAGDQPAGAEATTESSTPRLVVDRERHEYRLIGRWGGPGAILESVTDVLRGVGIINPEWYTMTSRLRGRAVHRACHLLDIGDLDWESLKPIEDALSEPITGYVKGWARFKRELGFVPAIIERSIYHPAYLYAGTPDRIGETPDGKQILLDIKTGPVEDWCAVQLSGYDEALTAQGMVGWRRRMGIQLKPGGDFAPPRFFDDAYDGPIFLNMLAEFRWRKLHGYAR